MTAPMTDWTIALIALLPPLAVALSAACRGPVARRLVAVQVAGSVATLVLAVMTFAFDQSSFIDLALCLSLLSLPGALVMALFVERWL